MISGQKTSFNRNKLFSINRQIYEKISSKSKLNIQQSSNTKDLNHIFITPTKLQKYTELYSRFKSYSKVSTKLNTNNINKTKSIIKPSFSQYYLGNMNSSRKYTSQISNFTNSILYSKTPNKKSRNIHHKFPKNSTIDKGIYLDKLYRNITSVKTQSLMRNTMKNLGTSYKKFFLNKKKLNITSTNKKNNNNKNINDKYNVKSNKAKKIQKYKISINDEECLNNNNNQDDKKIKHILDLKLIQNKIQYGLRKKDEKEKKKSNKNNENIQEFSFNRDFMGDNQYDENDEMKHENNDDIINLVNCKKEWCNLIQSNIISNLLEPESNKKIYEENYEYDTPQFTTLDEQKLN